ncbi:MAG: RsiV family protein [Clostridiales bacterium]|nr:RsiV family protein [Clostridiales bacterium]
MVEYCKQREKEYGTRIFYEGYEDDIPNILQDNTWFFDEKGFELIVNEYTIAPHVLGSFYVLIPYQELVGVKEEFIKK